MQAQRARLSGGRWHFQHGPIDIVIGADGDSGSVAAAHEAAWQRFETVLAELVGELSALRRPVPALDGPPSPRPSPARARGGRSQASAGGRPRVQDAPFMPDTHPLRGPIARRMEEACAPFRDVFITPMAAVAGAVAHALIAHYDRPGVTRAWVNNGGDIALHLAPGHALRVGLFADLARLDDPHSIALDARFEVHSAMPVRGIATSGWRGRSFSLGIADSVTVLARDAAAADAAATIIANAVDVPDPRIRRAPADTLKDDTDLGAIPVTIEVPALAPAQVAQALQAGENRARALQSAGLIHTAVLVCQGQWRRVTQDAGAGDFGGMIAAADPWMPPRHALGSLVA